MDALEQGAIKVLAGAAASSEAWLGRIHLHLTHLAVGRTQFLMGYGAVGHSSSLAIGCGPCSVPAKQATPWSLAFLRANNTRERAAGCEQDGSHSPCVS